MKASTWSDSKLIYFLLEHNAPARRDPFEFLERYLIPALASAGIGLSVGRITAPSIPVPIGTEEIRVLVRVKKKGKGKI